MEKPRLRHQCPAFDDVPLLESYWFSVVDNVQVLNGLIRVDAPDVATPITDGSRRSGAFRAPEAEWHFMKVGAQVVVTRQVMTPPSDEYDLTTQIFGNSVVGVLSKPDYRCPIREADDCYADDPEKSQRYCESDLRVLCHEDGSRLTVEVLDVLQKRIQRLEDVRRVNRFSAATTQGRLRLEVDNCMLYPVQR